MVTDRRRLGADGDEGLIRRIALAARAGVHLIQIRERDLPDRRLFGLVAGALDAVKGTRARVLVNERLDVALAAGADGVHLRAESARSDRVRAVARPGILIGRSIHSSDEAAREGDIGAVDYLLFGTVFDTSSKTGRSAAGLAALARAVEAARSVPVLAIGGVTAERLSLLPETGCAGFAAIGHFADIPDDRVPAAIILAVDAWQNSRR